MIFFSLLVLNLLKRMVTSEMHQCGKKRKTTYSISYVEEVTDKFTEKTEEKNIIFFTVLYIPNGEFEKPTAEKRQRHLLCTPLYELIQTDKNVIP